MAQESVFTGADERAVKAEELAWLTYALYGAGFFLGFLPTLIALMINYIKRGSLAGTWVGDHFTWQINTFWGSLALSLFGLFLVFVAVMSESIAPGIAGAVVVAVGWLWMIYRLVKGCLYLNDGKSVYATRSIYAD